MTGREMNLQIRDPVSVQGSVPTGCLTLGRSLALSELLFPKLPFGALFRISGSQCWPMPDPTTRDFLLMDLGGGLDSNM